MIIQLTKKKVQLNDIFVVFVNLVLILLKVKYKLVIQIIITLNRYIINWISFLIII
jgi:hypothetical protein